MRTRPTAHMARIKMTTRGRVGATLALAPVPGEVCRVGVPRSPFELRHDNPHWAVSSPNAAKTALEIHAGRHPLECSTKVAAVIVSRNNFQYFRQARGWH